ncbi:MAG TPA: hypothetical protein VF121_10810, partial [Thermoanaerobaculia bacterium]|nr:hypothetical protein [Thermoanaerobaculia bacterium]
GAVDALDLIGEDFDGTWFSGFEDYGISRFGPENDDPGAGAFWGVLLDGTLSPVGGCQSVHETGDQILWAFDAFSARPALRLAAADDPLPNPAAPSPFAAVEVDESLPLSVHEFTGSAGGVPTVAPAEGVTVAPVQTEAGSGFQTVDTADPLAEVSAADGSVAVTFDTTGWHRLKAQDDANHIRSNRLDVCVEPDGGGGCGPVPADAQLRVPERYRPAQKPVVNPPAPTTPAPAATLELRRVSVDPRSGTATLRAFVSAPGQLGLAGRKVRSRSADARAAGVVKLKVIPTAAARASLRRNGRLQVGVQVAYTPDTGSASSSRRTVTLKLAPRQR